jgi:hypothetical protein
MHPILILLLAQTIHYGSIALTYADKMRALFWKSLLRYWYPIPTFIAPTTRYFLGSSSMDPETCVVVPQDVVYIEDWVHDSTKKCVVRYAGEIIPHSWTRSPFDIHPRTPWIWVGDRNTEVDLTRTFAKFLVVGNRITPALVNALAPKTNLIYIESGTFKELEFPGETLTIEEYGANGSIQDRRSVHHVEEAVPTPVVGGRNDSVE